MIRGRYAPGGTVTLFDTVTGLDVLTVAPDGTINVVIAGKLQVAGVAVSGGGSGGNIGVLNPMDTAYTADPGVGPDLSAEDHVHRVGDHDHAATAGHGAHIPIGNVSGVFDATAPTASAVGDAAAVGSSTTAAHRDHVHGRESFAIAGSSAVGDSAAAGSATTLARSDHRHGREAFGSPVNLNGSAADGVATALARSDHKHALTVTTRISHTFSVAGGVNVPSGDTDFINPFFVAVPSGQTAILAKVRAVLNSGTSATVKLQKNGVDITGFTAISVTTTAGNTTPTGVALADDDKIALVVTAVSGSPTNMAVTVEIDYTAKVA